MGELAALAGQLALQGVQQHVAGEGGFAGAGDAGDDGETLERDAGGGVLQVVQVGAQQVQGGGVVVDGAAGGIGQGGRMGQIATGEAGRVGLHFGQGAAGDDLAAQAAGAGADVDQVIGAGDGLFVVFDNQQGVALVAQLVQGLQQQAVVARVQADGGFVQHVADALQVGAELAGQADALGLATGQGGGGAVEREVAQAHVDEEGQAVADLVEDAGGDVGLAAVEALSHGVDPLAGLQDGLGGDIGDGLAVDAHVQGHGVEALAMADGAGVIAVGDAGIGLAFQTGGKFILLDAADDGQAGAQAAGAPSLPCVEREGARIQLGVAGAAVAAGALGAEEDGVQVGVQVGLQAVHVFQQHDHALAVLQGGQQLGAQFGLVGGADGQVGYRQFDVVLDVAVDAREALGGQELAVHAQHGVALAVSPFGQVGVDALAAHDQRGQQAHLAAAVVAQDAGGDAVEGLWFDGGSVVGAVLGAQLLEQKPQEMVNLGEGGDGALAAAAAGALLDGDGGRDAVDAVHIGPRGRLDELAGVGVERFEIAALAFAEDDIEGQGGLAAARDAGDDGESVARDVHVDVLQVVLAGAVHEDGAAGAVAQRSGLPGGGGLLDRVGRLWRRGLAGQALQLGLVGGQCCAGEGGRVGGDVRRGAGGHDAPAVIATARAQVDEPVRSVDEVEVVLDDQHGVAGSLQRAQGAQQSGDVVEVQAGGGFVEQVQRAASGEAAAAGAALAGLFGGFGQEAGQLQALGLAARQGGHGLAKLQVVETDLDQRLQAALDLGGGAEEVGGLAHGHFQHVDDGGLHRAGHGSAVAAAADAHVLDLGAEAPAVAVGAAQVHVGQELHLDVLEAVAAAGGAAAVAAVEAEDARGVAAFAGQLGGGKLLADQVEGADVADRVAAGGLADGGLVDEDHAVDLAGADEAPEFPGGLGGQALLLQQGGQQHVLHEGGLAAAGNAGQADEPSQRDVHVDALEVVGGDAFKPQARGVIGDGFAVAGGDVLAAGQVVGGEGLGGRQPAGRAIEDDLAAPFARARADVDDALGGEHHLRVVLDHHQRIAGVAQPLHDGDDAVHVARVQADGGLIEDEERVDQRGAQCGGEVDALHFAAGERARLAVEREVVQAHVAQEAQPGADLGHQQLGGFVQRGGQVQAGHQPVQPVDGQQHEVVQGEARQGVELGVGPLRAHGAEAPVASRAFRVGIEAGRIV